MFWYIYAYLVIVLASTMIMDRRQEIKHAKDFFATLIIAILFGWLLLPGLFIANLVEYLGKDQ
jgi:hypothetical protein